MLIVVAQSRTPILEIWSDDSGSDEIVSKREIGYFTNEESKTINKRSVQDANVADTKVEATTDDSFYYYYSDGDEFDGSPELSLEKRWRIKRSGTGNSRKDKGSNE